MELDQSVQDVFECMIDSSIVERYDSDLERLGEDRHGKIYYRPLDTDRVITLLVGLWGDLLTPEAINEAFDRLIEDQDDWPHGYCEEDEEERSLSSYDDPDDEPIKSAFSNNPA